MIEFVRNHSDHSTDRGYQFEFRCDHCYSGYMSSFDPSFIGAAGGLLQAAGSIFGGLLGSAGNSAYDIQRTIGGPAHDRALQNAVTEVKQKFRRCQRCGKWVCAEICWNEMAAQCTGCTPKYEQELISMRTQAQVQATQDQLREKASNTDYVSGVDMNPDAHIQLQPPASTQFLPPQAGLSQPTPAWQATPTTTPAPAAEWSAVPGSPATAHCTACGATLNGGKFCSACGTKVAGPQTCSGCGRVSAPAARFCEDCGHKF
jgi:hypothetical protein